MMALRLLMEISIIRACMNKISKDIIVRYQINDGLSVSPLMYLDGYKGCPLNKLWTIKVVKRKVKCSIAKFRGNYVKEMLGNN